ncbi:uncharacterized protein FOMMEDRAFT_26415 [Fomitiporia mediterranea MF3/22]|uniref:uncharacterized protein n=1 Tax=Fomitiporia mediterranea (strain MF3/22) TaxID=694068 RepID=UPI0004407866|nr:uncharacterized protein FOMMEDRAFT_26415 [Fomitiporia mediterranea MF3/22]EJD05509.1 hypothetical protein FOMMEDRAFT_26415 [Fomitiporia mediterranea MF3/22]
MSSGLVMSNEPIPAPFRSMWLAIVARCLSSWGFFISIFLSFTWRRSPPPSIETNAARYRRLTPRKNRSREEALKALEGHRVPPCSCQKEKESGGFFAKTASRFRRLSMPINKLRAKSTITRPRAQSDPTSDRGRFKPAVRQCKTLLLDAAAKSTAPARPIIKGTRTAFRRSLFFVKPEECEVAATTAKFFEKCGTQTKNAFTRSTAAIFAASQNGLAAPKAEVFIEETEEVRLACDDASDSSSEGSSECNPSPRQRRLSMRGSRSTVVCLQKETSDA